MAAALEDKMTLTFRNEMNEMKNMMKAFVPTPVPIKAVEERCTTCGNNHSFNMCPMTRGGYEAPVYHDNFQQFQQTASVGNFVQNGNSGYRPSNLANHTHPPGFPSNQGKPSNQGNIPHQMVPYQSPPQNSQIVLANQLDNFKKTTEGSMQAMRNHITNLKAEIRSEVQATLQNQINSLKGEFKNELKTQHNLFVNQQNDFQKHVYAKHVEMVSSKSKVSLQFNINFLWYLPLYPNGKTLEGPSTPLVPTPVVLNPQKEPEQNPETSTEKVQKPNLENTAHVPPPEKEESIFMEIPKPKAKKTVNVEIQDLNSPRPIPSKLPYPERIKVRENDKPSAQHSRFLKMFKQLRLEIGLKYALVEMPKFNKWLSSLLRNKEKLEEIAITTVNAECSAIIMNKVHEKLEDPGKFLIPCALKELDGTSALADSGASINLLPHSIYKKLGLEALTPTRMTLELAMPFL
ncbi:reverse transcriptase domain-containing protein [Tanacetum coccineum]